jgi:hypothetical protein
MAEDFENTQMQLDVDTAIWAASANRQTRKLEAHNAHCETKRMKAEEDRCTLVELAQAKAEEQGQARAESSSRKPDPLFQVGQSVHHYWASWFSGCQPGSEPQVSKKKRPAWYSAEVSSVPTWKEQLPYAGSYFTGWTYLVY